VTKSKILCFILAASLAVSLSRDQQVRGLYRKYSNRFRRRAKALADAWTRPLEPFDYPIKGSPA
jgi:hypothetical protein